MAAHPAIAQEPASPEPAAQDPTELQTITVMAPRITYEVTTEGNSTKPMRLKVAEKSANVGFGDLDLTRTADLYTLEERVATAAAKVCEELTQEFPDGTPSPSICTRRATEDAMTRVQQTARRANR